MTVTLICFALGMTEGQNQGFTSSTTLVLLITAAIGLASFLILEARIKQPMLDLNIFRNLQFSLSLLTVFWYLLLLPDHFYFAFFLGMGKALHHATSGFITGSFRRLSAALLLQFLALYLIVLDHELSA
jgi:hypothetical protein